MQNELDSTRADKLGASVCKRTCKLQGENFTSQTSNDRSWQDQY